ncbi:MAG: 3-dehydroquinate synthase [Phycisphaerae bacterium]
MREIRIELDGAETRVLVGGGVLADVGRRLEAAVADAPDRPRVAVISDDRVAPIYAQKVLDSLAASGFEAQLLVVPAGEASKGFERLAELYRALAASGFDRESVILALGGGVVSDLAGFAAATWMRGVRFAICPTTMESDVDACLGGKTAINLPEGKNLVGAFHQPFLVAVDPQCLSSLDVRDVRAGLAESVKHAVIHSEAFLAWHESMADQIVALDQEALAHLIFTNLQTKAHFVTGDARESGASRVMLNFGHTLGHAIEACSGYRLRHGECISLGMVAALHLSRRYGLIEAACVDRVSELLKRLGLPIRLDRSPDFDRLARCMRVDKKSRQGRLRFVLIEGVGKPVIREDVGEEDLREIVATYL